MEALLNVIAIIAACLLLYRITVSSRHPIFNFSDRISERGLLYKISELGSSCAATERGNGLDVRKVRSSLYKTAKQLKKMQNSGQELDSAQKAFLDNIFEIIAAADSARRKLRFGYLLGSVGSYPRLFLFCNELVENTGGCVSVNMLKTAVKTFNAKAPLTFTELKFMPHMLYFCLCGLLSQVMRSVQGRSEIYRRGVSDGSAGRADIDSIDKSDYVCGLFSSVGSDDERSVLRIAESNDIDSSAARLERNKFLAKATATILSIVASFSVAEEYTDDTLLDLSNTNDILCALPSYSDCDTPTKTLYLSRIEHAAVKRRTSEAVIAHECADTVNITHCDVADHILGTPPKSAVGWMCVSLTVLISLVSTIIVFVNLPVDFIALTVGAVLIIYAAVGKTVVFAFAKWGANYRPKLQLDKIEKRAVIILSCRLNDGNDAERAFNDLENVCNDNNDMHFGYALIFTAPSHDVLRTLARELSEHYDRLTEKNRTVVLVKICDNFAQTDVAEICNLFADKKTDDYSFSLGADFDYGYAVTLDDRVQKVNASDMLCEIAHPYCRTAALACNENSFGKFYNSPILGGIDWEAVFARGDYYKNGIFDINRVKKYVDGAENSVHGNGIIAATASCGYAQLNGTVKSDSRREFYESIELSTRDLDVARKTLFFRKKHSVARPSGCRMFFAVGKLIAYMLPFAHIAAVLTLSIKFSWFAFGVYASLFIAELCTAVYSVGSLLSLRPLIGAARSALSYFLQPLVAVIRCSGAAKLFAGSIGERANKRVLYIAVAVQTAFGIAVILLSAFFDGGSIMILFGGAQMLAALILIVEVPLRSVKLHVLRQKRSHDGDSNGSVVESGISNARDRYFDGETEYKIGLYGNGEVFATADNRGEINVRHDGIAYPLDARLSVNGSSISLHSCSGVLRRHCAEYFKTCDSVAFRAELFIPSDGAYCILGITLTNRTHLSTLVSLSAETAADGICEDGDIANDDIGSVASVALKLGNVTAGLYMSDGHGYCETADSDRDKVLMCVSRSVELNAFERKKLNIALIFDADARAVKRCAAVIDSDGYYEFALTTALAYAYNTPRPMTGLAQKLCGDFESDGRICDVDLPTVTVDTDENGYRILDDVLRLYDHLDFNTVAVGTDRSRLYDIANKHKEKMSFINGRYSSELALLAKDISVVKDFSDTESLYVLNEFASEFDFARLSDHSMHTEEDRCFSVDEEYDVKLAKNGCGFLSDGTAIVDPTAIDAHCGNILCGGSFFAQLGDGGGITEFGADGRSLTRFNVRSVVIPSAFVVIECDGKMWSPTYDPLGKGRLSVRHGSGFSEYSCAYDGFITTDKQFAVRGKNAELFSVTVRNTSDRARALNIMFAVSSTSGKSCGVKFDGKCLTLVNKSDGKGFCVSSSFPISEWCAYSEGYCMFGKVDRACRLRQGGVDFAPAASVDVNLLPNETKSITFCLAVYDNDKDENKIDVCAADAYFLREAQFYSSFKDIELHSTDKLLNNVYHRALYLAYAAFVSGRDGKKKMSVTDKLVCCFAVKYADAGSVRAFIESLCARRCESDMTTATNNSGIDSREEDMRISELLLPLAVKDFVDHTGEFKLLAHKATCMAQNGSGGGCSSVMEYCMAIIEKHIDIGEFLNIADERDRLNALLLYCDIRAFLDYCPSGARKNKFKAAYIKLGTVCGSFCEKSEAERDELCGAYTRAVAAYCGLLKDGDACIPTAEKDGHADSILSSALSAFALYCSEEYDKAFTQLADAIRNAADSFFTEGVYGSHAVAYAVLYITVTEKLLGIKKRGKRTRIDPCTAENSPHIEFYLNGQDGKAHIVIDDSVSDGPWHIRSENIIYATDCVKPDDYPASLVLFRRGSGDGNR